jgi:hypothetical protein
MLLQDVKNQFMRIGRRERERERESPWLIGIGIGKKDRRYSPSL